MAIAYKSNLPEVMSRDGRSARDWFIWSVAFAPGGPRSHCKSCASSDTDAVATLHCASAKPVSAGDDRQCGALTVACSAIGHHGLLNCVHIVFDMNGVGGGAGLEFQRAGLQAAIGYDHTVGNADQLGIGEHLPGAQAAIVIGGVNTGLSTLVIQTFAGFANGGRLICLDRDDH